MNNENLYSEIFKEFEPSSYGVALLWKIEKFGRDELNIEDWDKLPLIKVLRKLENNENPFELLNNIKLK